MWGCLLIAALFAAEPLECDYLLRGATIYDGTVREGQPRAGYEGDVAIRGDRIVGVGTFAVGRAGVEIDCRGLVVCPGFIDLHTHSDEPILDRRTRSNVNYLLQGCTTVVTGNCGSGQLQVADFYQKLETLGCGSNVAHLLPQGSIRGQVVGGAERPATAEELAKMRALVEQGMRDGAWGISTGLIYVPSSYASQVELTALARGVAESGGLYVSHIRHEDTRLLAAVDEALQIGREAGVPVHISHFKSSGRDAWGLIRVAIRRIEEARAAGERVTADQYPYTASSTSLEATLLPTWARAGGTDELRARLDQPETAARIREHVAHELKTVDDGRAIRIARYAPRPEWIGKSIFDIAGQEERPPLDIVLEITRGGGATIVNFSMSEDDIRTAMSLPWVATASDGRAYLPAADKPHPRSYGTFPRKVGRYAIEERVLPLAAALRSCTSLPAEILGLSDRGRLEPALAADVLVFDPQTFRDQADYETPHAYATGVRWLFVNGELAIERGLPTGNLAGKPLRKRQAPAGAPRD